MKYAVHSVDKVFMHGGIPAWQVKYAVHEEEEVPGNKKAVKYSEEPIRFFVHIFPAETLEWRAAEYEIDPANVDELLDIVLGEPFAAPEEVPALVSAPSIEEARARHTARCAQAKMDNRISSRGIQNPLEMIRAQVRCDPSRIKDKKKQVQDMRRLLRRENRG